MKRMNEGEKEKIGMQSTNRQACAIHTHTNEEPKTHPDMHCLYTSAPTLTKNQRL